MAVSTNGIPSPEMQVDIDTPSFNVHSKRKRETSISEDTNGIADLNNHPGSRRSVPDPQQQVSDLIEVLKSYDTKPSVLNRQLPTRDASKEPQAKRKKSDGIAEVVTVISRASTGTYLNLKEVVEDVKVAATAVAEELRLRNGAARTQYSAIPPETSEAASKVIALRKKAEDILRVETALETIQVPENQDKNSDELSGLTNGSSASTSYMKLKTDPAESRLVLTVFGNNTPTPKQLFSSLQEPFKSEDGKTEIIESLREAGLPPGISTTQVAPVQSNGLVDEKKRVSSTIGALFSTSSSILPYPPPKPSRATTTRNTEVGWYQPSALEASRTQGNQSYYGQHIKSGQWLDYNGLSTSVNAKRRHRERALSLSGKPASASDTAEQEAAKLEALFRSAYSSFAPSKDDAASIVPEGVINRVWWRKVGEKRFERLIRSATDEEETVNSDSKVILNGDSATASDEINLDEIEQAIEQWDEAIIDPRLVESSTGDKSTEDKEVQEILDGISELLETLNSYQRNRYLSINPIIRPGASLNSDTAAVPSKPSEEETATYEILKAQLTLMIASLPPYAVSKLNSDQLGELNISTKIQVLTENHEGVMEEDEATVRAKMAQLHASNNSRPAPVNIHRASALYGNQYASSSPRTAISSGQQYYGSQQTPVRTPSTNMPRPSTTTSIPYGGARPVSSTSYQSQGGYATPTYAHQLPRNTQSQYGTSTTQQYYQTPGTQSYGQTQPRNYGAAPVSNSQWNRHQASNSTPYQHSNQVRPQGPSSTVANGMSYQYGTGNGTATRQSPTRPPQTYSPQSQISQVPGRSFGTPTPSSIPPQARGTQYFPPQALTNGSSSISPQPQVPQQVQQSQPVASGHLGATGYHTVMTPEQQSTMMERQRAQLAQQQGTQHQARNAAQAGAMSVSPAPQANGSAVTAGH